MTDLKTSGADSTVRFGTNPKLDGNNTRVSPRLGCVLLLVCACGCSSTAQTIPDRTANEPLPVELGYDVNVDAQARQYVPRTVSLVEAHNSSSPFVTPIISVDSADIYRDEYHLMRWVNGLDSPSLMWNPRVAGELMYLKKLWLQVNPGKEFPGYIAFALDAAVPFTLLRNLVATATVSGFPDSLLYVCNSRMREHVGALHVNGRHPAFAKYQDWSHQRYVSIYINDPSGVTYAWFEGEKRLQENVSSPIKGLGQRLNATFQVYGLNKSESDRRIDLAVLDGAGDLTMGTILQVIDETQVPKRPYRLDTGQVVHFSALDVMLGSDDTDAAELRKSWPAAKLEAQKYLVRSGVQ